MAPVLPFVLCLCVWVTGVNSEAILGLFGANSRELGNIGINISGSIYGVCDHSWTDTEASVACRMFGYALGGSATKRSFFGTPTRAIKVIPGFKCNGREMNLGKCSRYISSRRSICDLTKLAGVICAKRYPCGLRPYDKLVRGRSTRGKRIVGGSDAAFGEYPWYARIVQINYHADGSKSKTHLCGGTVISEYWILTAAHCLYNHTNSKIVIVVGYNGEHPATKMFFFAKKIILHKDFKFSKPYNNIALLMVKGKGGAGIFLQKLVQPACLPQLGLTTTRPETTCEVAGWGRTDPKRRSLPRIQQGASVRLMDSGQCNRTMLERTGRTITGSMVCTEPGRPNPCLGDRGSPLVCKIEGMYTSVGITSWAGEKCDKVPPVYTKVASHENFYLQTISQYSDTLREKQLPEPYYTEYCGQRPYYQTIRRGRRSATLGGLGTSEKSPDALTRGKRIVGGQAAPHGKYPWQVNVMRRDRRVIHCGAAIISDYWILGAAHCFYGKQIKDFIFVVGDNDIRKTDEGEQTVEVEEMILHSRYDSLDYSYDIALLKVKKNKRIRFTDFVQPVCLPNVSISHPVGEMCEVTGWGETYPRRRVHSNILQWVALPIVSQAECKKIHDPYNHQRIKDHMMCAGSKDKVKGTLNGDSGAPLVCNIKGVNIVIGLTSWSSSFSDFPGIYTKVQELHSWIYKIIREHSDTASQKSMPFLHKEMTYSL